MNEKELNQLLFENTERENYYLENPDRLSPSYDTIESEIIQGRTVLKFSPKDIHENEISIRKDSRYTFVPFHIHTNINLNYIYSGGCTYLIDGKMISLQEGDVCIFDTNVIRAKDITGERDIVINITMSEDFFYKGFSHMEKQSVMADFIINALFASKNHNNYLVFRTDNSKAIAGLFKTLLIEYYSKRLYRNEIIQAYLNIIFMELMRLYYVDSKKHLIQISQSSDSNIIKIMQYIEKNYEDCTLEALAEKFCYHPKYLSSLIKSKTGKTFKQIQLDQRLRVSCSLLKSTDNPINDIATEVGIVNLSYFYKKFQEHYGVTPNEYRKTN